MFKTILNKEALKGEKAVVESFQQMVNLFQDIHDDARKRKLFCDQRNNFKKLFNELESADEANLYGSLREGGHSVNYSLLQDHLKEIKKMEEANNWDYEAVESFIEDLNCQIELLKENSFDEYLEDSFC